MDSIVVGKHAVKQLLKSESDVNKIMIQEGINKQQINDILDLAKKEKVVVQSVPKNKIDAVTNEKHQGIIAYRSAYEYKDLEELLGELEGRRANLMILDGINDPHNLGSILRTADAAGFKGIIIPKRRSVQLTDTVAKTSTGAIETVPVVRVTNLNQVIETLKSHGFWIAGTDGSAKEDYRAIPGDVNLAVVIGSEGEGMSKKLLEKCDFTYKIPMIGEMTSLNASVSAALLMYEVYRKQHPIRDGND